MLHFSFIGTKCRVILACLHFNENVQRQKKTTKDGRKYFNVTYPKFSLCGEVVREVAVNPTYVCYKHQITNSQFTIGHAFKDNGKIWKTKQMAVTHLYPEAEEQLLANQVVASVQTPQQPQRCCGLCGKPRRGHPRSGCMTEAED
ncbi:uncharacterized protein LOC135694059 [Rhopilema esculentum]|uniref:uncharacterized protein LOC135694059 n=1 Tax=Rhopilema esculentum TaxID=499914 RepID=UPI0031DF4980